MYFVIDQCKTLTESGLLLLKSDMQFIISVLDTQTTTTTTTVTASTASINLFTNGHTLHGNPDHENQMIQLNTIFITATITAVIIILPVGILILHKKYRCRNAVEDFIQSLKNERVPTESQDRMYDEMNEGRSGFATNANTVNPNKGLAENKVSRENSYQTLDDAVVTVHAYQSVGESAIDISQEGEIDVQRSNYEPLSRRNIEESTNTYDQV